MTPSLSRSPFLPPLPIDDVLNDLRAALADYGAAVLVAAPGAGKTTRVPLALMDEAWCSGKKIIMLEPRRLAARAAAARMAQTLGEPVGATIGLRVRLETRISQKTRIEVVTEGVFSRMILDDPALDGVGAVVFDEFHERSLDGDLGLALAIDSRSALRDDLRVLVMSATIDAAGTARLLGETTPVVASEGRMFPIETRYLGRASDVRIEDAMTRAIADALASERGSILAFLPGRREIDRTLERLRERVDPGVVLAPLHGSLDRAAQDLAVAPTRDGSRKVVLATSIAETSLTIEGVRVVIDSGLARLPRFEPAIGLTRLETRRASRAAVDQRRGRAGRTEPGVCLRLWEEAATNSLERYAPPEILSSDLSGLVLDLADWGVVDPTQLAWLDPPPAAALAETRSLLQKLEALDADARITAFGRALRALPLPPRLARMVKREAERGAGGLAAQIAVVLTERGLSGAVVDISERVARLRRDRSKTAEDARRLARNWARTADSRGADRPTAVREIENPEIENLEIEQCGALLAIAYPDRIARARGRAGEFLMANGRAAALDASTPLARETWLTIAEAAGPAGAQRILAAAALTEDEVRAAAGSGLETREETAFDRQTNALRTRRTQRLGAILFAERILPTPDDLDAAILLAQGAASVGLDRLPWTPQTKQLRDRVAFVRAIEGEPWPDFSDATLAASAGEWLAPHILGRTRLDAITSSDLENALRSLLDWAMQRRLDEEAPSHFTAPTGSTLPLDYSTAEGPALHVRVQELYGLSEHPTLARGKAKLTLHLLSPAHRPIQITRDLPGFWRGSWAEVAAEMRGRYPKHVWPDDPTKAAPTTRAKPRGK